MTNIDVNDTRSRFDIEQYQNDWYIYDSLNDLSDANLEGAKKILRLIYPDENVAHLYCVKVFQQTNTCDCGLYALQYAKCLMSGMEPGVRIFDESQLRENYNSFIAKKQAGKTTFVHPVTSVPFPGYKKTWTTLNIKLKK